MILLVEPVFEPLGAHGPAVELPRQTDSEFADIDHFLNFTKPFLQRFTSLPGHQGAKFGFRPPQRFTDLAYYLSPFGRRDTTPGLKGLFGQCRAVLIILLRAAIHGGQEPSIHR